MNREMGTANCSYKTASDRICTPGSVLSVLSVIFCLSLIGCGPKHPATVPIRGTVTYGGGPWPKDGTLFFTIADARSELPQRPGIAKFDVQGNFAVSYMEKRGWLDAQPVPSLR